MFPGHAQSSTVAASLRLGLQLVDFVEGSGLLEGLSEALGVFSGVFSGVVSGEGVSVTSTSDVDDCTGVGVVVTICVTV